MMSGKCAPNENSVMTCERFISDVNLVRICVTVCREGPPTSMVNVLIASISMTKGGDV